ncbi:MAG: carbamoyl-phosphate synthase large subunit, partial [Planctomycetes bacterium]|nr:carbamoyl-phosphate synthase large subunit [Planctomycetota bacterium]
PRVSRSSALASKATGFPIAKIAAKLAVGYTLDEIPNDITRETPASFEPSIDYVVVKAPRFAFEKFPEADATLTTSMKSVGETMAIGRSFQEALQKALRGLEVGLAGLEPPHGPLPPPSPTDQELRRRLFTPNADRLLAIRAALERGWEVRQVAELTRMDPWFLDQVADLVAFERQLASAGGLQAVPEGLLREAKRRGYSDVQLGRLWGASSDQVRDERARRGVVPTYKMVDTCAAEFEARTPYYYSTYESECEVRTDGGPHVVILGGGPNRIGQGIEFDYCCCQAAFALREAGYRAVMVNSNPETVSTDYDTSDLLFFEPLTHEDVVHVCERVRPVGVIVQFGGQTPLNLARGLQDAGLPIVGTSVDSIERAEDRGLFARLLEELDLRAPASGTALDADGARSVAARVGYPVMVRPSFVLGGRAMEICYDEAQLARYMDLASGVAPGRPILVDRFLDDAIEVDVDCVADGTEVVVGGILEHIEEAGIHSGDASCAIPPYTLDERSLAAIRRHTTALALALEVKGLMNVQFAVQDETVYVLEVNPRASRTVPFVSKAVGLDLARIATRVMMGRSLRSQGVREPRPPAHVAVKKSVFPFGRFPGVDILLGPEMRSTGEVMGLADDFPTAFAKAQAGASEGLPTRGAVLVTVRDDDKRDVLFVAHRLSALGFELVATRGTAAFLERHGVRPVRAVAKVHEGRPNPLDVIRNGEVALVINTPGGPETRADERRIRALAVERRVPCITTLSAAQVVVSGIEALRRGPLGVRPLQDYHAGDARDTTASRAPNPTPTRRARGVPS